ncbi:MAG: hypothetical protein DRQ88_01570 [Epsilonproteobacteria bacterium]|nr:MAG: hypothetical protein DRQ89_06485 [Campylobacterota bacterium]RLA67766.1 MAG: hypothetical protein DRQ88_01570 [Campylobacterota bacterium]
MKKDQARKLKKEKKRKEHIQKNKILRVAQKKVTTLEKIAGKKHLYIILSMALITSVFIFYTLRN